MINENIKLKTTVQTRGNVTKPCPLPSSSLHVRRSPHPCTGLFTLKSWDLTRSSSMGLPGRKLQSCLDLVASQILPGNANKPGKVQNMKWVPPRNRALLSGCQSGWPLLPVAFHLAYTKSPFPDGELTPILILTNFQNIPLETSIPTERRRPFPGPIAVQAHLVFKSPASSYSRILKSRVSGSLLRSPAPCTPFSPAPHGLNTACVLLAECFTCKAHGVYALC